MKKRLALFALLIAAPAAAQGYDYQQRARDLVVMSRILGELHHIRRACEAFGEEEVWRERMRRLIELESPQADLRNEMVAAFNEGFRNAEARFPYCDREARDYAAAGAAEADDAAARLMAPLYDALSEDESARDADASEGDGFGADDSEDDQ